MLIGCGGDGGGVIVCDREGVSWCVLVGGDRGGVMMGVKWIWCREGESVCVNSCGGDRRGRYRGDSVC